MRYIKQRPNQCLLAAYCQISDADYDTLAEDYDIKKVMYDPSSVYRTFAPIAEVIDRYPRPRWPIGIMGAKEPPSLRGTGLLIIRQIYIAHAVSYENGMILDPEHDGTLETWDTFYKRMKPSDWYVVLINAPR